MFRRFLPSWSRPVLLALALPCLLLACLIIPGGRPQDALARRWQKELATLPAEEVPVRVQQLVELGDAGLVVLAESLFAQREETADAANAALEAELIRWRGLPALTSSRKAALLAHELARHTAGADDSQQRAAAELAARIIVWPIDRSAIDSARLLADCEQVLRSATRVQIQGALVATGPSPFQREQKGKRPVPGPPRLAVADDAAEEMGNGPEDAETTDTRTFAPPVVFRISDDLADASESAGEPDVEAGDVLLPAPARFTQTDAKRIVPEKPLGELADLDVMRLLHTPDEAKVERELMRRGYTAFRIRVARRMTDPNPAVRRELAELLPQMSGLDARPWLLWLSRDEEPSVRRAAAAILATSSDPQLLARLREMRATDGDSIVLPASTVGDAAQPRLKRR